MKTVKDFLDKMDELQIRINKIMQDPCYSQLPEDTVSGLSSKCNDIRRDIVESTAKGDKAIRRN